MNLLYATSFRNEQVVNNSPSRLATVLRAGTLTQSVTAAGYVVGLNYVNGANSSWYAEPTVDYRRRYVCYSLRIIAQKAASDATGFAWQWAKFNLFGHEVVSGEISPGRFVTDGQVVNLVVIHDKEKGTCKAYVDRKFVGSGPLSTRISWEPVDQSASKTCAFTLSDLAVLESDEEQGQQVTLTDVAMTEIENNWAYTGTSLVQSLNKTNTSTLTPNAQVYRDTGEFTINGSENPLLVEGAGFTEGDYGRYSLAITSDVPVPATTLQAKQSLLSAVVEAGSTIKVNRVDNPLIAYYVAGSVTVTVTGTAVVNWGDGTSEELTNESSAKTLTDLGTLVVYGGDSVHLSGAGVEKIKQFGTQAKVSFEGCTKLVEVPTYIPKLLTNCEGMFAGCTSFNSDIQYWQTSNITNMDRMFSGASAFNRSLDLWDVSTISTEPTNFGSGFVKPVWGTRPPQLIIYPPLDEPNGSKVIKDAVVGSGWVASANSSQVIGDTIVQGAASGSTQGFVCTEFRHTGTDDPFTIVFDFKILGVIGEYTGISRSLILYDYAGTTGIALTLTYDLGYKILAYHPEGTAELGTLGPTEWHSVILQYRGIGSVDAIVDGVTSSPSITFVPNAETSRTFKLGSYYSASIGMASNLQFRNIRMFDGIVNPRN